MPVLRQAPDNTLAETLGNLGSTIASGLNPMNQIRANNLASEMAQRQFEMQKAANLDAANRNAADVYERRNPFNEDPASLAVSAAKIRNGQGDLNSSITALTAASNFKSRQDAAALISARHPDWDQTQVASAVADVGSGRKNIAEVESDVSSAKLTGIKTDQTQAGVSAATTPLSKEAAALGQPDTASKLDAGARAGAVTGNLTPEQIDKANADRDAAGYPRLPLGTSITAAGQPAADAATAAREGETQRQKDVADAIAKGTPQTGNIFPGPLPGQPGNTLNTPYNPTPPAPPYPPSPLDGATPPSTAPTPKPDVMLPNVDSPASLPVPVTRQTPAGTIVGETPAEATKRQATDTETGGQIKEAVAGGEAGVQMMALIDRLRVLSKLAQTGGSSQLPVWVDGWLRDHHLVATDRQGILAEMASLFKAQIPALRKDMGVKFEAGPELSAQGQMIGDPNLPEQVLEGIFARQAAIAQIAIDRRELALRVSTPNHPHPLSRADYLNQDAQVMNTLSARMKENVEQYGGYTPRTQAPPPVPQSSFGNAFRAMLEHLGLGGGGPPSQPPTPPTAPTADELWDVQNGKPVRVR